MSEQSEGFYDDSGRYWPAEAEWCDRCQGMGSEECLCGGDFCCCGAGETECRQCGGDGYFVPTAAFKERRAATAKWWAELNERLAQGTSAFGQDAKRLEAKPAGPVGNADAPEGTTP